MQLIFEHGGRSIPFQSGHDLMKSLGHAPNNQFIEMVDESGQVVGFGADGYELAKSHEVLARGREVLAKAESSAAPIQSRDVYSASPREKRMRTDFSGVLAKLEALHRERFA